MARDKYELSAYNEFLVGNLGAEVMDIADQLRLYRN